MDHKLYAEESEKTKKARQKIKEQMRSVDEAFTDGALQKKLAEIKIWIARHAKNRVVIKNKVSLFDQNQNTAKISQAIASIMRKVQKDAFIP